MYSVQVSIMRDLIYGAVSHGASLNALCERMGIDPRLLTDAEKHVDWETAAAFWVPAVEMTGDEQLGLHIGQHIGASAFGMLGFLSQSCQTIEDTLNTIVKFNNTISSIFKYNLAFSDDLVHICFEPHPLYETKYAESARQAVEVSTSSFTMQLSRLTGKTIRPVAVELTYSKRAPEEYERVLHAPVKFGAARNCITITKEHYRMPIISYDRSLFALFNAMLVKKQNDLSKEKTLSEKIRSLFLFDFNGQVPALEIMASHLTLTPRTLQRKLTDEGTSYRALAHQLRKELATEMLNSKLKKQEIASLLGYTDDSTLRRQYKVWGLQEARS
ncbi:AraC family transcriptional regulator [Chryseolinea lacunae]|uniref:AraC family transcriptional regulator ligand-binding domain-containing protein n=1 Tax=Chryseolinea lacunae TaxID=2801331 RepID=A0ABS1KTU9_9BACT|nr:AraC family transcriptional regulator [Chryseolinea lacunae]MBL0742618.1 AraC family transcriptional regulator ligand-binding domain-containing protein [Chryseolinea lacunae]